MLSSKRVSVALCTHNGARYIGEQVASILAQTYPVDEIIIGDDASDDETLQIIHSLVENSSHRPRLVVRKHDPALGVRRNFEDAIAATTGDVIALSDQDDIWHPQRLELLLPYLEDSFLVHSDALLVDGLGESLGATLLQRLKASAWERANLEDGDALAVLLRRNLVTGATVVMDGNFARQALPIPDGWIHDEWLGMYAALLGGLRLVPLPLTKYRQHENNQIGVKKFSLKLMLAQLFHADPHDYERRLLRATSIEERAKIRKFASVDDARRLEEARKHQEVRSSLSPRFLPRLAPILREVMSGNYSYYSRGILTIARDLFQMR